MDYRKRFFQVKFVIDRFVHSLAGAFLPFRR